MEVENGRCSYSLSKGALPTRQGFNGYRCRELKQFAKSHCIFHDPHPNKESGEFCSKLKLKTDHCFIGYVFPKAFTFPMSEFHDADFAHSHFHGRADFQESVFAGQTDLSIATFHQGAHFNRALFKGDVRLTGAEFCGQAWFTDVTLEGSMSLISTYFRDEFWFTSIGDVVAEMVGTVFEKEALFHNSTFAKGSFIETQFRDRATFGYFKHMGNVFDVRLASQSPDVIFFEGVDMKHLLFREADLTRASFNQCYNLDQASFYDCKWNTESGRNHVLYDELELRGKVEPWTKMAEREIERRKGKNQINADSSNRVEVQPAQPLLDVKHSAVEETCRAFKKHFEDRRNYLVAGDFHEGEMEMRRLAKGTWGRRLLSIEAVYWLLSRYGQSWLRPLACFIALNLTAAVIYSFSGLQLESERAPIRLEITAEPSPILMLESLFIYLHAFLYSFSVSALLRGVYATPTSLVGLLLQTVQFILGPLLILLIGLAIRRRVRR